MKPPVQAGDVLASKYRIERVLGSGAMGVVVAARQLDLGFPVAIKFMVPAAAASKTASARFIREARAAARLRSEHVARVIDYGKLEDGAPYIVMEYLEGTDLDGLRRAQSRLLPHEVAEYVAQACKGLSEAHASGIVHRDLKPHNLFLTRRPDGTTLVKILDFGVSKLTETLDESDTSEPGADLAITRTAAMMGTPMYMSPEQLRSSKKVDARSDIFSLGVTMYQLLSGALPFTATSFGDLVIIVTTTLPQPLGALAPNVPPGLVAVVDRCLAKDPEARYGSVDELAMALAPFTHAQPGRAGAVVVPTSGAVEAVGTLADAAVSQTTIRQTNRGLVMILAAVGACVVLGAVALVGLRAQSEDTSPEPAASSSESAAPEETPSQRVAAPEPTSPPPVRESATAPTPSTATVPRKLPVPRPSASPPPPPTPPPPPRDPFGNPD